ncbi:hypothetical protein GobsT_09320 [Gemmata obscuriglobus]|uniref:DUF4139 domain-containing protein n=1 Tax=Gemmata obscuriglobus TaxID=114 RepID=A0A2Z3H823_9BACT|nr:DUF4139 domain-containing protein [Gemmata obscuriglobus]AWM40552.1 DUF4139 domain-containing protein [Gemmata obscuriglobus]QEG26193.1 hypothetical protein GobsT_09320 [Gemmata obscuriglobus]VTS00865.1 Uncharacterized protein OS=Pirellula staleyi (strain ATCC 27377 / DSM 6068 / ICPB 4128) GN=Psta_3290 PE=4 SV=1: DUF4139 [Gemmata obscuriglobus UQM 2246]
MSKAKWLLWAAPVAGAVGLGVCVDQWLSAAGEAKQDLKPAVSLPISRVVLFNSGVGYFSRSGEVEGDARVDLTFPEGDVNDLLKSMVLEDFSPTGRVSAVSYDSREPIARTLSSFAINLTGSPTFAGILGQLRGERVEVAVSATAANQPGKLSGTIVGIEKQRVPAGTQVLDAEVLNLWCAEGMRAVRLGDVQTLRFSNPVIESEFRRALDVLALSHDSQKKSVSLHFAGDGRRRVQVGYVTEAPIWKTSYRLLLDAGNKEKPYLQGWAMVENPTDEDWAGVKMALVSGRPISFKMDLYNPLYVNRPTVEPELFASLRPVTYSGSLKESEWLARNPRGWSEGGPAGPGQPAGAGGGRGGFAGGAANRPAAPSAKGGMPAPKFDAPEADAFRRSVSANDEQNRFAKNSAAELVQQMGRGTVGNAATSGALGDFFQYTIDHPVTLPRQKSALLPIVGKEVEGARVSIYNPAVQAKHPLLGLRFKNTSGAHLNQGPVTVFEGSVYAGDTRVLDVQPNEERLVSYAIDLGTEVDPTAGAGRQQITRVKAVKGIVHTVTQVTEEKTYRIANRSATDRTVLIEHPNRTAQQVKLVDTPKPVDDTPEVLRFQAAVAAGQTTTFTVKEQRDVATTIALSNGAEDQIRYFLSLNEATPALKKKLAEALQIKDGWDGAVRELRQVQEELRRLTADQDRIRKNLRETPREAEVYATYLKKLSDQEKEIDALTAKEKQHTAAEFAARKKYEDYLANISD